MGRMARLPAKARIFSDTAENANLLKKVTLHLDLKKVNGYLHIEATTAEGYLFLKQGKPFNARFWTEKANEKNFTGFEAAEVLNHYCDKHFHRLSLYLLDLDLVPVVAGMATGLGKHTNLSSEFVDIFKLVRHLQDDGFDGFVQVTIPSANRCAICEYKQGRICRCILYPIKGYGVMSKLSQWQRFLIAAKKRGAIFSVFESAETRWQQVTFGLLPDLNTHKHLLEDIFAVCAKVLSIKKDVSLFEDLFVDACIQVTDQYPFMHPFDSAVSYEQGRLHIENTLDFKEVLDALNAVLTAVFRMAGAVGRSGLAEAKKIINERVETGRENELGKFIGHLPIFSDQIEEKRKLF